MDDVFVLLVPLAIAYFVAPIVAFFMALGTRKTVNELFLRVADLERKLALRGTTAAAPADTPAAPWGPVPTSVPPVAAAPDPARPAEDKAAAAAAPPRRPPLPPRPPQPPSPPPSA